MTEGTPAGGPAPAAGSQPASGVETAVDLAAQLDALRIAVGKVAALAEVAVESYDHADWRGADPALVERTAYLLGSIAEAAVVVVTAVDHFLGLVADRQRTAGDDDAWW